MAITKDEIREIYEKLRDELKRKFNRTVSFADYLPTAGSERGTRALAKARAFTTTF